MHPQPTYILHNLLYTTISIHLFTRIYRRQTILRLTSFHPLPDWLGFDMQPTPVQALLLPES